MKIEKIDLIKILFTICLALALSNLYAEPLDIQHLDKKRIGEIKISKEVARDIKNIDDSNFTDEEKEKLYPPVKSYSSNSTAVDAISKNGLGVKAVNKSDKNPTVIIKNEGSGDHLVIVDKNNNSIFRVANNGDVFVRGVLIGQKGDKGDRGDRGDRGAQGWDGPKGDKGDPGICPNCTSQSVNVTPCTCSVTFGQVGAWSDHVDQYMPTGIDGCNKFAEKYQNRIQHTCK
jgi:hypothetical protein